MAFKRPTTIRPARKATSAKPPSVAKRPSDGRAVEPARTAENQERLPPQSATAPHAPLATTSFTALLHAATNDGQSSARVGVATEIRGWPASAPIDVDGNKIGHQIGSSGEAVAATTAANPSLSLLIAMDGANEASSGRPSPARMQLGPGGDLFDRIAAILTDSEEEEAIAQRPTTASSKWTVKNAGNVPIPVSENYSDWLIEQIRRECTAREFNLPRKTDKATRIRLLKEHDKLDAAVGVAVDWENELPVALRKTKNCAIRLLNILFSDQFSTRFARIGDTATRHQLDTGTVNANTDFWKDVTAEFQTNTIDYNRLWSDELIFADLDPSLIVRHSVVKLYDMWKFINRKYVMAIANFTRSGTHDPDFFAFCDGSVDVAYLRACLAYKPNLTAFVLGGMLNCDVLDSSRPCAPVESAPTDSDTPKNWQMEVVKSINRMSDFVMRTQSAETEVVMDVDTLLDRLSKTHQLIDQVQSRLHRADADTQAQGELQKSLELYKRRLRAYESQLEDTI